MTTGPPPNAGSTRPATIWPRPWPGVRPAERSVSALEIHEEQRRAFDAAQAWRQERIVAIDAELERHWSTATLAALRQDDPLAFGIERLRAARAHHAGRLGEREAALPPERTGAVERAGQDLAQHAHGREAEKRGSLVGDVSPLSLVGAGMAGEHSGHRTARDPSSRRGR